MHGHNYNGMAKKNQAYDIVIIFSIHSQEKAIKLNTLFKCKSCNPLQYPHHELSSNLKANSSLRDK